MLRHQKGFIFNGYTFVVNKEDIHNARDDMFVEATALLPDRWISVKERLPEDNAYYLVWRKGWQIPSIMKCRRKAGFNTHMAYGDVTHWMPLPSPPREEDNDG